MEEIKAEHAIIQRSGKVVQNVINLGKKLIELRDSMELGYGEWGKLLKQLAIPQRTGDRCVFFANNETRLLNALKEKSAKSAKSATVADLTVNKAESMIKEARKKEGKGPPPKTKTLTELVNSYNTCVETLLNRLALVPPEGRSSLVESTIAKLRAPVKQAA